jgi:hypothetical protein
MPVFAVASVPWVALLDGAPLFPLDAAPPLTPIAI